MKPYTIYLCSSSRHLIRHRTPSPPPPFIGISHFSTSSPDSSSSSSSSYHSSSRRSITEDVRNVRVSVWWDFENCQIPCNVNVFKITQFITSAVRSAGIKGPIHITAFGDVLQLSRCNQEALSSTGVNLTHIPSGGKNSADRSLLVDLMYWISQNPPPAHLFLISGDRDFANTLHRLRMNNYNILLASTDTAPAVLCSAASIMWQWNSLVKGENLNGKHFNQPPDGPYASWYGHYRVALEDPFAVSNKTSCEQSEKVSDSISEMQARPIPNAVMSVIRNILNSYPKGLSITELRAELMKSNITVDKNWYGHKKFSAFLMAMPNLLSLQSHKDGQYRIRGISSKSREICVPTKDSIPVAASKEDGGQNTSVPPTEETLSSSYKLNETEISADSLQVQEQPLITEKTPIPGVELLKPICHTDNDRSTYQINTDTINVEENSADLKDQSAEVGKLPSTDAAGNVDGKPPGIFNRIVRWFKFWKNDKNSDNLKAEDSKIDEQISSHSEMQEILTETFWNDVLAFLETSKGSESILKSRSRQEMVQNLQQSGPSRLQSLSEKHTAHVVDLLISEKKWVVENVYQTFPFKITGPAKTSSSSKTFSSKELDDNSRGRTHQVGDSVLPVTKTISDSPKDRSQILSHCQMLVNLVVKQYPKGFDISGFKREFFEKYGYPLDVQQLGYQKLADLLQIMPGMKLESNHIVPSGSHSRDFPSEKNISSKTEDDNDSDWEELGPITQPKTETKNETETKNDFEPVSDNDLSDSEEEEAENSPKKPQKEESALLQILDSWHTDNLDGNSKTTNIDHLNDNMKLSEFNIKADNYEQKHKLSKCFTFVAEKPADEKEDLINGILGSLKKSANGSTKSKIQS